MKQNALLLTAMIGIIVVFIGAMVALVWINWRKFERLERQATEQAIAQHEENVFLRDRLYEVELVADSLTRAYHQDSSQWIRERAALQNNLSRQRQQANSMKQAYENTKKALEKQSISVPALPADDRPVYDLTPALGDSTNTPDGQ